jgi:hypothetical protein
MDVGTLLVTDAQSAELVEPGKGSLHDPSPSTEPTAMFGFSHSEQRQNAERRQTFPD